MSKKPSWTYLEIEDIAEEIRDLITHGKGMSLPDYIEKASKLTTAQLGYRRASAIREDYRLRSFFPEAVYQALPRFENSQLHFTEEDDAFIRVNANKGTGWIASRFNCKNASISTRARLKGIFIKKESQKFTPEEDEFICNNYTTMSWRQIGDKLLRTKYSVEGRAVRLGLRKMSQAETRYTLEKDAFIKKNKSKGSKWIAEKLAVSVRSVQKRAHRIGVKLKKPQKFVRYSPAKDRIIRYNAHRGSNWLSERLDVSVRSVQRRAKLLGVQIAREFSLNEYKPWEDNFIERNSFMGWEWIAAELTKENRFLGRKIERTYSSVEHRAARIGVKSQRAKDRLDIRDSSNEDRNITHEQEDANQKVQESPEQEAVQMPLGRFVL